MMDNLPHQVFFPSVIIIASRITPPNIGIAILDTEEF